MREELLCNECLNMYQFLISRFICFRIALQYKAPLSYLEALLISDNRLT